MNRPQFAPINAHDQNLENRKWVIWLLFAVLPISILIEYSEIAFCDADSADSPIRQIYQGMLMTPTIRDGESCLVDYNYYKTHAPKRGDIVAFKHASDSNEKVLSRIVGLPGEQISVSEDLILISGRKAKLSPLREEECKRMRSYLFEYDDFQKRQVACFQEIAGDTLHAILMNKHQSDDNRILAELSAHTYYLMNDNRVYGATGYTVPQAQILGKVVDHP